MSNQIKKGLLLSLRVKKNKIDEYLAKLQARAWLSYALCAPGQHTAKGKVKFSLTRYRALGPELIPVYRQSARR